MNITRKQLGAICLPNRPLGIPLILVINLPNNQCRIRENMVSQTRVTQVAARIEKNTPVTVEGRG